MARAEIEQPIKNTDFFRVLWILGVITKTISNYPVIVQAYYNHIIEKKIMLVTQEIEFTDFPFPSIALYGCWDGEHWVLMLPREY